MTGFEPAGGPEALRTTSTAVRRLRLAATAALLAAALAAILVVARGEGEPPVRFAAHDVAPLDLATIGSQVADHYRYAETHEAAYRQIPCFCGCEGFLGHRDLYDCFVRADGTGYDAHAAGCGVCIGESAIARPLLEDGGAPANVRSAVVAQFGATPGTAPGRAPRA
ncbi:MAG TPA: PCYCGC motif-containing (lipo)protein [Acidimicrobiia bacterium]|nr:PCYCGC motif-containing (lipo)protein [Acidimicrobiia bacterium]